MFSYSRRVCTGVPIAVLVIALATMGGYRLAGWSHASTAHLSLAGVSPSAWVSGTGSDSNSTSPNYCGRTTPCRTFDVAYALTNPGGVIEAVDAGDFGPMTITQAITIDGGASKGLNFAGGIKSGFLVNAGPNDVVTLRHLQIHGYNTAAGSDGIRFISGKALILEDVTVEGISQHGVSVETTGPASLTIINSRIFNNGQDGIALSPSAGTVQVAISDSKIYDNGLTGLAIAPSGGNVQATIAHSALGNNAFGLIAEDGADVNLADSIVSGNTSVGAGCVTYGGGPCTIQTENDRFDHNWAAVWMNHGAGNGQITESLSNDAVFSNSYGIYGDFGGTLNAVTFGNNRFLNNFIDGTASTSMTLK